MKELRRRFALFKTDNPNLGDTIILWMAIKNQGFSRRDILKGFKEFVTEDQFLEEEKGEIIDYLEKATQKEGKIQ